MRVVVIGGGIAGLAAAWAIRADAARRAEPLELIVLESASRAGGRIRTTADGGHLVEWAANAIQGQGAAWRLVDALGLANERVIARPEAARRYVVRGGRLHLLPSGPVSLLRFRGISPAARLRVLIEPIAARRRSADESVMDFAARHLGAEAARVMAGAAVRGIFAGDASRLSLDAAFPAMRALERRHRSLFIGMMRGAGRPQTRPLWSLARGMGSLTAALVDRLGAAVRLDAPALSIDRASPRGYLVRAASGERLDADAVVLAVPPRAAAALLRGLEPEAARRIAGVESASIAVAALSFAARAFHAAPDGFGYLVVPGEDTPVLGALFESNLFPERAPGGRVLVRVMMGGVDRPDLVTKSDADLIGLAMSALDRTHGLKSGPERTWVIRQENATPQYELGHVALLGEIAKRLESLPGIHLAGNAYRGASVASLAEDAERIAARVALARPDRRAARDQVAAGFSPPLGP